MRYANDDDEYRDDEFYEDDELYRDSEDRDEDDDRDVRRERERAKGYPKSPKTRKGKNRETIRRPSEGTLR